MTLWSRDLVRPYDKQRTICIHYYSAYGHQTWKGVTYLDDLLAIKSNDPSNQYNKLNIFYIHYHNAYGLKTWQDDGLLWGDSTHNVICDEDSPFPDFWSLHHKWCQSLTSELSISARTPSSDVRLWHHWWCRLQKSGNGCPSSSYPVNFFKVELKDP